MACGYMAPPRFWWNVDAHVGPGCPNKLEDYQLVQLGYASKAVDTQDTNSTPALRAIYAQVVPGSVYTGGASDPLTVAIKAHQKHRGGTQDGKISPIQSASGTYDGQHLWLIMALNNCILDVIGTSWPRLDAHPKCPAGLRAAVLRVFPVD